jgi:hypothetical protein
VNTLNPISVFPEAEDDRILVAPSSSRASGLEAQLNGHAGARAWWWLSYTRSRAVDTIDSRAVPRNWDQPNAAGAGLNLDLSGGWSLSFASGYHTGWPTTPMNAVVIGGVAEIVPGSNSERLPPGSASTESGESIRRGEVSSAQPRRRQFDESPKHLLRVQSWRSSAATERSSSARRARDHPAVPRLCDRD